MIKDNSTKETLYRIIFKSNTPLAKNFDLVLIASVLLSVIAVMLETVESIQVRYPLLLDTIEWFFTILFSIELILRIYCVKNKSKYLFSFYGLVDILSILPSYFSFIFPSSHNFLMVRVLRMLRIFRILKLKNYTTAGKRLTNAINASIPKITVFLGFVLTLVLLIGSIMYLIESKESGFTSIPKAVYWAIVTMTTVGYGDITPQTTLGQILSSLLMITGYGTIAIPTGLVTAELSSKKYRISNDCPHCGKTIN